MIVTLLLVLLGLWFLYDRFIYGKNLPPGPGRLPIIGSIIQMGRKAKKFPPHSVLREFSKEYGPVVTLQYGLRRQVIVDDYDLIKQLLNSDAWVDRPLDKWILERSWDKPLGILFSNGEQWREIRRFSIRTLRDFGFGKQNSQEVVMEEELDELFRRMDDKLAKEKDSSICMSQIFTISVLNILWSMIAGTRVSHDDVQLRTIMQQINENIRFLNAAGNILMAFPPLRTPLRKIAGIGQDRANLVKTQQKRFLDILHERRELGEYKDDQRDFVDVFLSEIDKHEKDKSSNNAYTDKQFVTVLLDLFGAGSETTANTLEFAMMYMLLNPQIQEKVRQEIDVELGRSAFPNASLMRNKMPYTEATLLEVQRLASVAPLVGRSPSTYQKILNYDIEPGTAVLLNLWSAHRNPKIWENPDQFNPQRFLNEKNEVVNADKLFPFGGGKRLCMGEVLARATLFTYFVRFLQNYTIQQSPLHPKPSTEPQPGLTLAPQPYHAVIKKRK